MNYDAVKKGAQVIINTCACVKKEEDVLIIIEKQLLDIAYCLSDVIREADANPIITIMDARTSDGAEPPYPIAKSMEHTDVFLALVNKSITHTSAVKSAIANGARGIMLTQFNEKMMSDSGVKADFKAMESLCKGAANTMENAKKIELTSSHGTHLTFSAAGRRGNALTGIVGRGEFAPVPTIEANVSPLEGTANGIIVANASIPYIGIGLLKSNVIAHVKDGLITSIEGGEEASVLRKDLADKDDPNVYNIAELGIGINPECRFSGFMLEDEGVYGSVHIGIGTSITLGGTVKAKCHYDLIMTEATITVDGKVLLDNGQFTIA